MLWSITASLDGTSFQRLLGKLKDGGGCLFREDLWASGGNTLVATRSMISDTLIIFLDSLMLCFPTCFESRFPFTIFK